MKQIVLLAAAAVLLASCNQNGGDAAMYKKQVDSLTQELAARPAKPTMNNAVAPPPSAGAGNIPNVIDTNGTNGLISNAMMDTATANRILQRWHKYVRTSLKDDTDRLAFMIDANILRNYILNNAAVTYLIINVAESDLQDVHKMTLTYVGAQPDPTNGNKLTELPFTIQGDPTNTQYIFEHVSPCPTCVTIGIHPGKPNKTQ